MGDGPRQQRAKAWAWVYLALFGADGEEKDSETESTDQASGVAQETSDGAETR